MKTFTKITLAVSGILFCIGAVCILIAGSMGLTSNSFRQMVYDGKFSFHFGDDLHSDLEGSETSNTETIEITEEFKNLEIEFGAGTLEILYDDVEHIQIEQKQVKKFKAYVEDNTLHFEGNIDIVGINDTSNASLTITLPRNMSFQPADLELGASEAVVAGLTATAMDIEVGAGQVTISALATDSLQIEIGAGQVTISELDAKTLDAEVGVGKLNAALIGKETDYGYSLDCGIGSVKIGSNSYNGLGTSQSVNPPKADRFMDVECGIGEVNITFME